MLNNIVIIFLFLMLSYLLNINLFNINCDSNLSLPIGSFEKESLNLTIVRTLKPKLGGLKLKPLQHFLKKRKWM
jgi:hypothetical protein